MAEWFRSWHGAPTDQKIALAARKAGVPRAVAVAVWWCLLDAASQSDDRGSLSGADPEVIAFSLDVEDEQVAAVIAAFEQRGMVSKGRIVNWERAQSDDLDEEA